MVACVADEGAPEPVQRVSADVTLALGAAAMSLVALFGEAGSITVLTTMAALAGLIPWTLVAGGVRINVVVFALATLIPTALIVFVESNAGGIFPALLALVWVTRTAADPRIVIGYVAVCAGLLIALAVFKESVHETGLPYFLGGLGISWLAGLMLRRQDVLMVELAAMNELRVEHAATAERARIAREVHDVVAHSLTVVMLHLTGARRALSTDPQRADEALARAETVGRSSLDSIRQVVGLLRTDDAGASDDGAAVAPPLPGIAELTSLVDGFRAGGLEVRCTAELDAVEVGVDAATELVVYRVVQESLSNALQHSSGAMCEVTVEAERSVASARLEVEVVNAASMGSRPDAANRTGLGVRGMAERVRAVGGTFAAGPTPAGGWRVHASLPIRTVAADRDPWAAPTTTR